MGRQGHRSDLTDLHESIRNGKRGRALCEEHFSSIIRFPRGVRLACNAYARSRRREREPIVVAYWGRTGTGKTRSVWDNSPNEEEVWVYPGNGWFDGFEGQKIALFDDFTGGEFKLSYLLKVLDRYPLKVPIKGDFVEWNPEEIYITSNLPPEDWYKNCDGAHLEALMRRISFTWEFK